jgi:hypothetical protein
MELSKAIWYLTFRCRMGVEILLGSGIYYCLEQVVLKVFREHLYQRIKQL